MKPDQLYQQLKDLHLYRNYDEKEYSVDISSFYHLVNMYPNDAFYLVDCKNALMHKLNDNFKTLVGDETDKVCELLPLYDHINDSQYERFAFFTNKLVAKSVTNQECWDSFQDGNKLVYKSKKGKTILKTTTGLKKDDKGCIIYTFGRLTDISNLIPETTFRYQFFGPHEKENFAYFNDIDEFGKLLGKRELEILNYVGQGYSSKRISEVLFVSKHTVDTHRRNIIRKLEVNGCIQAYNKAKDIGLF